MTYAENAHEIRVYCSTSWAMRAAARFWTRKRASGNPQGAASGLRHQFSTSVGTSSEREDGPGRLLFRRRKDRTALDASRLWLWWRRDTDGNAAAHPSLGHHSRASWFWRRRRPPSVRTAKHLGACLQVDGLFAPHTRRDTINTTPSAGVGRAFS